MKDYEADIDQAIKYLGLPNWYFRDIFGKFSSSWDNVPCSEIACCVSFEAGNLSKIYVSNYAEGMYRLYDAAGRFDHTPKLGDFIWFDYGAGVPEHTGRVIEIDNVNNLITTIEGNTNGGYVNQFIYSINDPTIFGYGHPNYTDEEFDTYNIRTVTPAGEGLPEYNTISSGGINSNSQGSGAVAGADVLNNSAGYTQGRIIEIYNELFKDNTAQSSNKTPAASAWSQGGINNTGGNAGSSTRIRTNYINLNCSIIYITIPTGYRGQVFEYTSAAAASFTKKMPVSYTFFNAGIVKLFVNRSYRYRFVLGRSNNGNITPADLPPNYQITGYTDSFPITNISDNMFDMFIDNSYIQNWLTLSAEYGLQTGNTPEIGAVGVWYSSTEDKYHYANVEIYQDNKWYISECYDTGFRFNTLDNNLIPAGLSGYTLTGFIYPYQVDYPPIGSIPEVPEAPAPYKKKIMYYLKRIPF